MVARCAWSGNTRSDHAGVVMTEKDRLYFADAPAWHAWLELHHEESDGVQLVIAKKGASHSSVTHAEALDTALCFGWIDGIRRALDAEDFLQTFTPRRPRSLWSKINRDKVTALIEEGRMRPAGHAEIDRAKSDGRWDAAYSSQKNMEVPDDLLAALSPAATAFFATLSSQNRYAILFRLANVKRAETRERNIEMFAAQLERGETVYPQKPPAG